MVPFGVKLASGYLNLLPQHVLLKIWSLLAPELQGFVVPHLKFLQKRSNFTGLFTPSGSQCSF